MTHHIIAIHGAGMHGGVFGTLATHMPLEALTLPGHRAGDSENLLLPTMADMAQWLLARLEGHAEKSIVLLGHSMGAALALAAARHPRVVGVMAMGAAPTMPVNDTLLDLAQRDSAAAQSLMVKWSCDARHPQVETMRQLTAGIMAAVPSAALATDLAVCHALTVQPPIQKPVLVVSGAADKMTPAERGGALAAHHGGGQVVVDAGHMMVLEQPVACAAAMRDFVAAL